MFDYRVVEQVRKLIGWGDAWDTGVITPFGSPLQDTETGEYYQAYNSAVRLANILACLPSHTTKTDQQRIEDYCTDVETRAITKLLNDIAKTKQIAAIGHVLASSEVVFNAQHKKAAITNESLFCGVMFRLDKNVGLRATINKIGMFLTAPVSGLDLYLFHSTQEQVVSKFSFTSTSTNSFSWSEAMIDLDWDNGTEVAGVWYLGYYQDDIATAVPSSQAIKYTAMNWKSGYCNQCGGFNAQNDISYKSIRNRLFMKGFYVQGANLPGDPNERFDTSTVIESDRDNFGFNFQISVKCNLTTFWIDNRRHLKNAVGLSVAMAVLSDMKSSLTINSLEENLKIMIVRDLEGATDTGAKPLWLLRHIAINAINFDEGNIHSDCLPCARKPQTRNRPIG